MSADPLSARLFGYGAPCRVRFGADGEVMPLPADGASEAERLARELRVLSGRDGGDAPWEEGVWALSMPLGRCGVEGLPLEHLIVYHQAQAYLDVLGPDGPESHALAPGAMITLEPGRVARLRALPVPGRQVVVAFQTEDRTPLQGNAAAFSLDGRVPDAYDTRLRSCHRAYAAVHHLADTDFAAYRAALERFFGDMAVGVRQQDAIAVTQAEARASGTYDLNDQGPLFARQRALLTEAVVTRVGAQDPVLFRFPGMFGAIAPLFSLLASG